MKLSDLHNGETAVIVKVYGHGGFRKRITEMGFVRGRKVASILNSPLQDPVKYSVMGYEVSLRHSEARMVEVLYESEADELIGAPNSLGTSISAYYHSIHDEWPAQQEQEEQIRTKSKKNTAYRRNVINIALVGNPNSGKTSLFNSLSGRSEHVGNYSGVTVDAKTGHFNYKNYHFNITDLPGTYSLSAYSPEEKFVRRHIFENMPDVIINAVVASNIERNLYLTTELIDLNPRMVVALNMFDELQASGSELDYDTLGGMIGVPMIPTVAKSGKGLENLLDTVIDVFENRNPKVRHIHINYGTLLEPSIAKLSDLVRYSADAPQQFPARYWAIKLLEHDAEAEKILSRCAKYEEWKNQADKIGERTKSDASEDVETIISDEKYGFIAGALQETYKAGTLDSNRKTRYIDRLVTDKWLGFPIFILLMWIMFMATFYLGAYPQDWIEAAIGKLGDMIASGMSDGPFKSLLINGVIGGVGSVIVFLPNILILYIFISFMEDSGYMARAAFIMDRIMHKMGLHGKSFIPLLMGFGCNVPAIMASRTIESHSSRLITILINPFMSCSARIPVFLLLSATFFPHNAGTVLISLYLLGIVLAILTARMFRNTLFKIDETPFVMELPPYRLPTLKATLRHTWDKGEQYLKKMGGVILIASVIIWFLSYYPQNVNNPENPQFEQSYLGKVGKFCEPVMRPLGLNWKASVALLSGTTAKEVIVSTLGVLYKNEDEAALSKSLASSNEYTPRSSLSFMIFVLIYFPCIASLAAISNETGSRKWALFSIFYNTILAWVAAFAIYRITGLF
ncbi:MAG: ferrous iron transport protein B [Tannerella sp.]|nr:ferrous iron transport protein B [Tannerella sp.]